MSLNGSAGRADHYRPEIDGLRAIAVLIVMLYHARIPGFSGGYTGVDIFFVLSGYLITRIIVQERSEDRFRLATFWIRRARRILPALITVMAACIPPALLFLDPAELESFGASLGASSLFSANIYFWRASGGYFALSVDRMPLIHLWSLAVEEQFYLLYPVALLIIFKFAKQWLFHIIIVGLLSSLLLSEVASFYRPTANFFLLPTRAWELLAGAGLAVAEIRGFAHWIERRVAGVAVISGLILIAASVFILDDTSRFPGISAIPVIVGTCLVVRYSESSRTKALLTWSPIVFIGLISYSAYLWHQPVLVFAQIISLNAVPLIGRAGLLVLSLALAVLSWRFIEQPIRRGLLLPGNRQATPVAISLIASLFACGFIFWKSEGLPHRLAPEVRRLTSMNKLYSEEMLPCFFPPGVNRDLSTACYRGPENAPVTFAIVGDSHAAAIAPAFDELLMQRNARMAEFVAAGCPPVLDDIALSAYQKHCAKFNRTVVARIQANEGISTVILHARWTYYIERSFFDNGEGGIEVGPRDDWPEMREKEMARSFKAMVSALLKSGKRVVLVYPVPEPGWDVPRYLAQSHRLGLRQPNLTTSYSQFQDRNRRAYGALDDIGRSDQLIRLYPAAQLCNVVKLNRCSLVVNGMPLYFDDDHLSREGGSLALPNLAREIQ